MSDRDNTDIWTAVTIGAIVGIGTALIVRARQEDEVHDVVRRIRRLKPQAEKTLKKARRNVSRRTSQAADTSEDLVRAGREMIEDLRREAADIVRSTHRELERAARKAAAVDVDPSSLAEEAGDAAKRLWKRTRRTVS